MDFLGTGAPKPDVSSSSKLPTPISLNEEIASHQPSRAAADITNTDNAVTNDPEANSADTSETDTKNSNSCSDDDSICMMISFT